MKAKKAAHDLDELLRGINSIKDRPSTELMSWIEDSVRDIRDVLLEEDPVKQRAYLIVIALRQATRVEEKMVFGERREFVYIEDRVLYNWAIRECHKMPERFLD